MDILNKPISELSFADIDSFCKQGLIEGIQLDYKKDLPPKGLAKHFAAFSNTRGGVIIVGVEEDKTGKPLSWDGIAYDAKLSDKIHQYASNVSPIPSYEVHLTDQVNNKAFILIRIFEGDMTPYYVHNDVNMYVRTGNITSPIDLASPDAVELLFRKNEKAEKIRNIYISNVEKVYKAALERAEKERIMLISQEKEDRKRKLEEEGKQYDPNITYPSRYFKSKVGTRVSMCQVLIQPFAPTHAISSPLDLKENINNIQVTAGHYHPFPGFNMQPIPQGLLTFDWNQHDGNILSEQIYGTGLIQYARDIMQQDEQGGKRIYVASLAAMFFSVLRAASNIYNKFGYQGGIKGFISLTDTTDAHFVKIQPEGWNGFFDSTEISLLPEYKWELDFDTSILNNNSSFEDFFIGRIKEIYWSLGFGDVREDLIRAFLVKNLSWQA